MNPIDELATLLRPAGGGLYLVSTGLSEQRRLQQRLYGVDTEARVQQRFRESLERIASAKAVLFGVPSDVGAGFRRGANLGPVAIRGALMEADPAWTDTLSRLGIVDIGDVFVVPQLLHDEMLSAAQLAASRKALYPSVGPAERDVLPVSPLSIAERALDLVLSINPKARPFMMGGDHSCAWPVVSAMSRVLQGGWGIVQPDAHTDLLAERLGVRYCFATWSYHANELLGRGGKLVQVGVRASQKQREHWETTLGVRQFWAEECRRDPAKTIDRVIEHLRGTGVKGVYFSNDIDGTDATWADATGTPEPDGLTPEFVLELIARLGRDVGILGGDIVEVAPPLGPDGGSKTVALAARYFRATLDAALA